jgi:hypothetical protein
MVSTRLIGWRTLPLPLAGPASGRGSAVPMSLYLELMGDCSRLAGTGTIAAACVLRYRSLRSMVLRKTRSTGDRAQENASRLVARDRFGQLKAGDGAPRSMRRFRATMCANACRAARPAGADRQQGHRLRGRQACDDRRPSSGPCRRDLHARPRRDGARRIQSRKQLKESAATFVGAMVSG